MKKAISERWSVLRWMENERRRWPAALRDNAIGSTVSSRQSEDTLWWRHAPAHCFLSRQLRMIMPRFRVPRFNRVRWKRWLVRGLVWAAVLIMLLRWFEHHQVYHPDRSWVATPADAGSPCESVGFTAPDGLQINGWFLPAPAHTAMPSTAILQSHGNAGNVSHRIEYYRLFHSLGCAVLAYDYRGYGRSEGHPSEEGTYLDAVAAFDWLHARGFTHIIAFGESLGGAIATELALRRPVAALALSSTFTSVPDLGSELFPFLPVRTLSRIRYDNRSKLPRVQVPVLILHSRTDSLVGFQHAEQNHASAREPKLLREIRGDHNDQPGASPDQFRAALLELLKLPGVTGAP